MAPPLPAGWRLRLAAGTRVVEGGGGGGGRGRRRRRAAGSPVRGSILVGGSPLRILTLSGRGTHLLRGWLAGQSVGEPEEERVLARRLLDAGLADPDPPARPPRAEPEVTIVVPVYADPDR